ncbi:MAG: glucose 1-dehydrogenase [Deltaproteobacteria bacterium]|jgi:gluconate 5-dehydrogenase|nr:MAG: glucose 1-dehydrogenase [Deltaproteobacteria bacterium]
MVDLFRLDGKIAVVIGGAGGIGETLALGLSQNGAKVVVASRNLERLKEVAKEIQAKTGGEVMALQVDVTDEDAVASLVEKVLAKFGTVDILVNAMGLNIKREAVEYPMEDWDLIFNVNVKGTMITCKHFGRVMRDKKQGKIINMSSVRGIRGYTGGNTAYCATKGAVELITKTLALEWAPYNIHVNALGPALIITPGTIHIQQNPELAKKYKAIIPMNKLGVPEDLIGACVFLASEASNFITGQTLYIDGGLTAG